MKSISFPLYTPGSAISAFVRQLRREGYDDITIITPVVKMIFLHDDLSEDTNPVNRTVSALVEQ